MKIIGNLTITKENAEEYKDLVEVGGDLDIYSKAELNNLESVGGGLYIKSKAELNNLKSVGGGNNLEIIKH